MKSVGKIIGATDQTISKLLKKYNIPSRIGSDYTKGRKHTEETRRRMRESQKQHWEDPEEHKKCCEIRKKYYETHSGPNKGRVWSEEAKRNQREGADKFFKDPKNKPFLSMIAKRRTDNHPEILERLHKGNIEKRKFRKDLGSFFRSTWEANFARICNYEEEPWHYEAHKFKLSNGKIYIPDFYLPYADWYIEIKGYWYESSRNKVDMFKKEYPTKTLVIIDTAEYKYLTSRYSKIIDNWEK